MSDAMVWEIYSTMDKDAADRQLRHGWEPFAVTSGNMGLMYHLRKQVPAAQALRQTLLGVIDQRQKEG